MWRFLIKAPYLGKLCVIYDVENKGLSYFSSDENKGLKSIAEIRCSVIKSLITDSMVSIRLVTLMLRSFPHMHHGRSYGFSIFMEEVLAHTYLPIPLETELFKISQT